jgi:hypothetical protein
VEDGRRALAAGDTVWSGSANTAFHETVLDLAGNESLRDLLEPLSGRLTWLFRQTRDHPRVQAEHEQLFAPSSRATPSLPGGGARPRAREPSHAAGSAGHDEAVACADSSLVAVPGPPGFC